MVTLLIFAVIALASAPLAVGQALNVTLIHINDHHSHLDEISFDLRGDQVPPGLTTNTTTVRAYMGKSPFVEYLRRSKGMLTT